MRGRAGHQQAQAGELLPLRLADAHGTGFAQRGERVADGLRDILGVAIDGVVDDQSFH